MRAENSSPYSPPAGSPSAARERSPGMTLELSADIFSIDADTVSTILNSEQLATPKRFLEDYNRRLPDFNSCDSKNPPLEIEISMTDFAAVIMASVHNLSAIWSTTDYYNQVLTDRRLSTLLYILFCVYFRHTHPDAELPEEYDIEDCFLAELKDLVWKKSLVSGVTLCLNQEGVETIAGWLYDHYVQKGLSVGAIARTTSGKAAKVHNITPVMEDGVVEKVVTVRTLDGELKIRSKNSLVPMMDVKKECEFDLSELLLDLGASDVEASCVQSAILALLDNSTFVRLLKTIQSVEDREIVSIVLQRLLPKASNNVHELATDAVLDPAARENLLNVILENHNFE